MLSADWLVHGHRSRLTPLADEKVSEPSGMQREQENSWMPDVPCIFLPSCPPPRPSLLSYFVSSYAFPIFLCTLFLGPRYILASAGIGGSTTSTWTRKPNASTSARPWRSRKRSAESDRSDSTRARQTPTPESEQQRSCAYRAVQYG